MCGIAGFIGMGSKDIAEKMIQSISYRGPDFHSVFQKNNVYFGHARLSIIDVSANSHQPMLNTSEDIVLIFNGEIYNYLVLKEMLQKEYKCTFKTTSDTEVLLKLYEIFGVNLLDKINGMFVFAIYDFKINQLFIARDRMGKKPLYYTFINNTFIFGSELKAVIAHPIVSKEINIESINQYLTFDYIPTPLTLYKNIFKLKPAHYLIVENNTITCNKYWSYNFEINKNISFDDAKNTLDYLLNEATKSRLMSDVPLGVFLSGGLDSSTIAYYAQKNSNTKIKTFSIGFEEKSYDEKEYALQVANHLGTDHYCDILSSKKSLVLMNEIFNTLDEPFADASIIPTYYLSKFTRQHVTVSLGGDGSDELLAGYPTFISENMKFLLQYFPPQIIKLLINGCLAILKPKDNNISLDFKINQFLRGFLENKNDIHQLWLGSFIPSEKANLFNENSQHQLRGSKGLSPIHEHFNNANNFISTDWNKIIYYYCQTYLLDDILFKVDRASMYNSLEVRSPFLDRNVVEFINSLPKEFKIKNNNGKYILKKMMEDKLPNNIIHRPKKGFGIPLSKWIREDLKTEIESTLFQKDSFFNQNYIVQLLNEHNAHKKNNRKLIWNLYSLKKIINN